MIKQIKYKNLVWVDVLNPTKEETASLVETYGVHMFVQDELRHPTARPKIDLYDEAIYIVLHFPDENSANQVDSHNNAKEIDFVIGQDFLITVHYEPVQPLEEFANILEASDHWSRQKKQGLHAGHLFYYIIRQIYESLEPSLDFINDNLKRTEKKIFNGQEKEMVRVLAEINRHLLDFRWTLKSHEEILQSLSAATKEFFGEKFDYHTRQIIGEYRKVMNNLENNEQSFGELRNINESMLDIKNNEIMKTLAVLAFVFLPITMIASIFGMSGTDSNMPIIKSEAGFWIAVFLMVVTAIVSYLVVKLKKWL